MNSDRAAQGPRSKRNESDVSLRLASSVCLGFLALHWRRICAGGAASYPQDRFVWWSFRPGIAADIVARLVARHWRTPSASRSLSRIVQATAACWAEAVARAPNDGRTLFVATVANTSIRRG